MTPSKKVIINPLKDDPSKAEEINFLKAVAGIIPQDSYLSHFFTPAMVTELERRILDDFYCDIYEDYQTVENKFHEQQGLRVTADARVEYLMAELSKEGNSKIKAETENATLIIENTALKNLVEEKTKEIEQTNKLIFDVREAYNLERSMLHAVVNNPGCMLDKIARQLVMEREANHG